MSRTKPNRLHRRLSQTKRVKSGDSFLDPLTKVVELKEDGSCESPPEPRPLSHVPRISSSLHQVPCAFSAVPSTSRVHAASIFSKYQGSFLGRYFSSYAAELDFSSLTDARLPKRRPATALRRKRASLKPPGPYAWVQYVPDEPILSSRPNEGSIKGRNEKKRIKQHKAFILSEKKKRKVQYTKAQKERGIKRIERKMAAVAREKAWAQRLVQLQQLQEAKAVMMT